MKLPLLYLVTALWLSAQAPCVVDSRRAEFRIAHVSGSPKLTLDDNSSLWKHAARQSMWRDCSRKIEYPNSKTEIKGFWTDTDLYLLFRCPYSELNLFLPANHGAPRAGLWDRDVVEMFLGDDWQNIRHYREFEIAPTGDWIDLAIDLDHKSYDHNWRSGWETLARVDEAHKVWYAAAHIPLKAVSTQPVSPGTKWRMNLYRIDGIGADPQRHFLCWQPTCVQNRDPNHVPENFGTLVFGR
jgi:hypothetical protein